MDEIIYKIAERVPFEAAMAAGAFGGAPVDIADGYIHFSTAGQVRETARRHFGGKDDLILVAVAAAELGAALKYEPSRGGDLFPHLYGPLAARAVRWAVPLPRDASGNLVFPDIIP